MWYARTSRRDLLELLLGSSRSLAGKVRHTSKVVIDDEPTSANAYWEKDPAANYTLPSLIVTSKDDVTELLAAINSSPQAPTPISALCRILTREEAVSYFSRNTADVNEDILPATVSLAMLEAVLHSEGRVGLRQLSPAMCRRTLSYACGRAVALGIPAESLAQLPSRWLETYALVNGPAAIDAVRAAISAIAKVLMVSVQLGSPSLPDDPSSEMAASLFRHDKHGQELAWDKLSRCIESPISLQELMAANREHRGVYLQQALRMSAPVSSGRSNYGFAAAACAFVATQVAPGSLEHAELLRSLAPPEVLAWYALFAVLQSPIEILAAQSGLGQRLLRDVMRAEDYFARPTADIAFAELKTLERAGLETISRKLSHTGEIEVELVPLVMSSFTYHSKATTRSREPNGQLPLEPRQNLTQDANIDSIKARLLQEISVLTNLVDQLPESDNTADSTSSKRRRR